MRLITIFFFACLFIPAGLQPQSIQPAVSIHAKVIGVKDGDTIEILMDGKPMVVRLAHIDCPELRKGQPYAKAAKQFTSRMCFGQVVTVLNDNKFDRYKRLIGVIINSKGENVNKALVASGLAWHFKKYSSDDSYAELEQIARQHKVGLWRDKTPMAPWDWRHH